ncbi:protein LATERAL BRANCHING OXIDOREDUCTASE 1-like [Tasmannia lanceolata]|uniref:protein LATERAL BRANCHING OXIDOREDUCTASE 1-like n=1 Tax=Tasmannia lanceolata TaxID=3420 RepID=UPI004062C5E7
MARAPRSASPTVKVGHVHDVQELRKARPTNIPDRYVRDMAERPTLASIPTSMNIPVIDMSELKQQSQEELAKLALACEEWGFFQVINHGINTMLLERIQKLSMEFFMLPLEEKEKYPMAPGTIQGYGHAFVFSENQKLDWCNMLALGVEPRFMRDPKLWPTKPAHFIETLDIYSKNIRNLCQNLLRFISKSLGLKPDVFNDMFGAAVQAVRMNYYPPCSRPDLVLGLSPHSDGSALTVLQQDTGSVGLQIFKENTWVPVHPIPNALVINIGDTIEVLTNGKYKSVEHRAVTNKEKDRLSVVTFYAPSYEIELGPLPEFIDKNRPCKYRRYNHGEYSRHYITNKLEGKRSLDFAKIQSNF